MAELVARDLRTRIITGELADGDTLPPQEELSTTFDVSLPSIREALRILEAEGLVTVRRGSLGGAVVHVPGASNAGYMIGLALMTRQVSLQDLSVALSEIEPVCAGLAARQGAASRRLAESLQEINDAVKASVDDIAAFVEHSRRFHETLVKGCGNETLILTVGALESLWSRRATAWARDPDGPDSFPSTEERRLGVAAHDRIADGIRREDPELTAAATRDHLDEGLRFAVPEEGDDIHISIEGEDVVWRRP